jgi:hypothetical protein
MYSRSTSRSFLDDAMDLKLTGNKIIMRKIAAMIGNKIDTKQMITK